ncbi:C2H2-type domain-containing protein [Plasmodiophora brassicae]|uniref:C2H2-type domain-containing protein n=1 Tax=Plasmodiophora brassicae TaxID=37360 RepID=A0A0G4ISP3_PLABS|nr:hypothetical protein PBRA_006497 [Plasmodiophora brassicae]SPQ94468.1 unnamed protein product [Plasmodiophora brassicae]
MTAAAAAAAAAAATASRDDTPTTTTTPSSLSCDLCDDAHGMTATDLRKHRAQAHPDALPYGCNKCGRRFKWSGSLSRHDRIHSGVKPFKCDVCERRFTQSVTLQRHKRTHTGERPFVCPVEGCGRTYASNTSLRSHQNSKHKTDTESSSPSPKGAGKTVVVKATSPSPVPAAGGEPAPASWQGETVDPLLPVDNGNADDLRFMHMTLPSCALNDRHRPADLLMVSDDDDQLNRDDWNNEFRTNAVLMSPLMGSSGGGPAAPSCDYTMRPTTLSHDPFEDC